MDDALEKGRVYTTNRRPFKSLDDQKAIEYHKNRLKIAMEIGDRGGEAAAYGNLGNCYQSLSDYRKSIEYHEKHLKIAIEIGDRGGEGRAYGNLGRAYSSLGDYQKSIEYHEKILKIALEIGDGVEKEEPMEILVVLTVRWVTIENPLSTMRNI